MGVSFLLGAADRGRTGTGVIPTDFKSGVSANSTTAAKACYIMIHEIPA